MRVILVQESRKACKKVEILALVQESVQVGTQFDHMRSCAMGFCLLPKYFRQLVTSHSGILASALEACGFSSRARKSSCDVFHLPNIYVDIYSVIASFWCSVCNERLGTYLVLTRLSVSDFLTPWTKLKKQYCNSYNSCTHRLRMPLFWLKIRSSLSRAFSYFHVFLFSVSWVVFVIIRPILRS